MTTIQITTQVNANDYPMLSAIAAERGHETIGQLLASIAVSLAKSSDPRVDDVELLVRSGMSDAEVALELNLIPQTAKNRRRRLGLAANPRYRKAVST